MRYEVPVQCNETSMTGSLRMHYNLVSGKSEKLSLLAFKLILQPSSVSAVPTVIRVSTADHLCFASHVSN